MSKELTMDELLASSEITGLNTGDVIEGVVTLVKKNEIWVDLGGRGVGVVMRREVAHGQPLEKGQTITVSVVDPEMEEGHALLSMKRAVKDRGWDELQRSFEANEIIEVIAYDANRGGLLVELEGIRGFLPVSQLAAGHYPRVSGADKDEILQKLNALTNIPLRVRVLDVSRKDNKLIFSEKEAVKDDMQSRFSTLKVGDVVEGVVTGVIDFGAFVNVDGIEGLIHISEISWERVDNPRNYIKVGENLKAKIIAIDRDRPPRLRHPATNSSLRQRRRRLDAIHPRLHDDRHGLHLSLHGIGNAHRMDGGRRRGISDRAELVGVRRI